MNQMDDLKLPPLPTPDYSDYDFYAEEVIEAYSKEKMQEFAKQAVEAEREACALKCEKLGERWWSGQAREQKCADAIRARSQA